MAPKPPNRDRQKRANLSPTRTPSLWQLLHVRPPRPGSPLSVHNNAQSHKRHCVPHPAVNSTIHYYLGKIGFVPQTGLRPSRLVHPQTALWCLVDVKPVDTMTLSRQGRDPSPLVPALLGGTKIALYAPVKSARPRQEAIPVRTVVPAAAYTFSPAPPKRALESSADDG